MITLPLRTHPRRSPALAALLGLLLSLSPPLAMAAGDSRACERRCLLSLQNAVLDRMLQHAASEPALSPQARVVHNGLPVQVGAGPWRTLRSIGARIDVVDTAGRGIATFAAADDGQAALLMVRLAVQGGRITELEIMTVHKGDSGWFPLQDIRFWDPLYDAVLPPPLRPTRERAIEVANLYFEGIERANGELVPFDRACDRYENARKVTNRQDNGTIGLTCAGGLSSIKPVYADRGVRERRFPIVDEERGLVVGIAFHESRPAVEPVYPNGFDLLDFTTYPDSSEVAAGRAVAAPARAQALYVADVFKVIDGKLRQNDVFMKYLPYGTRTGFHSGAIN